MAQMNTDSDGASGTAIDRERAQAIILAGFILAIGIVAAVAIMNTTIESINLAGGSSEDVSSGPVDYRETMQSEGTKALEIVNALATQDRLHWTNVNKTYVNYTEDLNFRLQKVIESQAAVEITDIQVNSSFNNSWRMRKNQSTSFQQVVRKPAEVVFAIDSSGSMGSNDFSGERYDAVRATTRNLSKLDRVAVVDWDHDAGYNDAGIVMRFQNGSGAGQEKLNQTVQTLKNEEANGNAQGFTYLGGGIRESVDLFREDGKRSHTNYVILLSDGLNTAGWFHFPSQYAESYPDVDDDGNAETGWGYSEQIIHEWGFVDTNFGNGADVGDRPGSLPRHYDNDEATLNDRSVYQATKPDNESITVYTIGLDDDDPPPNGCSGVDKTLMEERIANATGGKFFCTGQSGLNSVFQQIADDISEPTSLASNVSRFDRFQVTVDEFSVARNLTVRVRNTESENLLWQMNVSNRSNKLVTVGDNTTTHHSWNWTDPAIGGTPLEIDVLDHTINDVDRNLSSGLFGGVDNVSVIFDKGQGVNGTYDVWTDTSADVTGQCADSPGDVPCGGSTNQTVGAIREANFTVRYESDDVTYTDDIEVTSTDDESLGSAPVGGSTPSPPSPPSSSGGLHFDPAAHDFATYWPMDQNSTDGWLDEHAFDASENNHTGGLQTGGSSRPTPDDPGINQRAYDFAESDGVVDIDGWNDIPLEGGFTVTFWIKSVAPHNGTVLDATGSSADFEMALFDDGKARWEYDGSSGSVDIDTSNVVDNDWHQVALVGGWNQSAHGLFVRDANLGSSWDAFPDQTPMGIKPRQEPIGSGSYGATLLGTNLVSNSGNDFLDHGFQGRIDGFRLYHDQLASATFDVTTHFEDGFTAASGNPQDWSTSNSAGKNNDTFNDDKNSVYTCCEADSLVEMKNTVDIDLSSESSAKLDVWIQAGESPYSDPPNGQECNSWGWFSCVDWSPEDNLAIEYTDSSGTWNQLDTIDGDPASPGEEFQYSTNLPADALHGSLQLRFRQTDGDGAGEDYWHIDNVEVTSQSLDDVKTGKLDQVYNDVEGTASTAYSTPASERDRYFVTEYKTFDNPVDVRNLKLQNVVADNGSGDLRVRAESNVTVAAGPENVSAWTTIRNDTESYDIDPDPAGAPSFNMSVPNDEVRLRVEADAPDTTDAPQFHEADLVAP